MHLFVPLDDKNIQKLAPIADAETLHHKQLLQLLTNIDCGQQLISPLSSSETQSSTTSTSFTAPHLPQHDPTPAQTLQLSLDEHNEDNTAIGLSPEEVDIDDVYLILRLLYADGRRSEADALRELYPNLPPPRSSSRIPRQVVTQQIESSSRSHLPIYAASTTSIVQAVMIDPQRDYFLGYHAVPRDHPVISTTDDYFQELGEGFYFYTSLQTAGKIGKLKFSDFEIVGCYIKPEHRPSFEETRRVRLTEKRPTSGWDWVMGLVSGDNTRPCYDVQHILTRSWGREVLEAPAPIGDGWQLKLGYGYRDFFVMMRLL